ncbi:hypothetical protein FRACYDRAFT_247429 [Fragilariopsis cylindrus CCMP1102]|uniref:Uncharacterized protein n=1 Tax=Fragilariopsis cylindrus CCMP1102 TaxID=635003 RepID=A0A1E7EWV1_9STRA|nr:hypothetical protein FRACYDRAFT_247429 [Fragilariopsis cylindrus CCMP1102]|eukprot:OEU10382.1 hypothetical protein FRACYDRAFT_247429 [Fragilariopsis cylindrus CCMP1102]
MEIEEYNRNKENGEHILCEKLIKTAIVDCVFNFDESKLATTSEKELAEKVHFWSSRDRAIVRGTIVPCLSEASDLFSNDDNLDCEFTNHQCSAMFENDSTFISQIELSQTNQANAAIDLGNSKITRATICVDAVRQGLKAVENNNELYKWYENEILHVA